MNFLVVSDIDVHQLNLTPIKSLQFLVENPFKKNFAAFFEQQMHNKLLFLGKNHYLKKKGKTFIVGHCIIF